MNLTLLNKQQLEKSSTVANSQMNRERNLEDSNSYEKELHLNPLIYLTKQLSLNPTVAWLDICCGSGKALSQAAELLTEKTLNKRVQIIGIDLVNFFYPTKSTCLELLARSIDDYNPTLNFDLITCVHGLHYIGDKLSIIFRAIDWLTQDGLFLANIDPNNFCNESGTSIGRSIIQELKKQGFSYNSKKHLITYQGKKPTSLPYHYLGASDLAGANYTGQAAINSYYKKL